MTNSLIDEKIENAPGIPAENIYYYSDPLKAAYMAMVFHFRLRIENNYGTFMSFTDWVVMQEREKHFRRAILHTGDFPLLEPRVGDIVKYWHTTEPDYFSQSTAKRTKEHIKRVTKHLVFYITKVRGVSNLKIIQRDEIAFFPPERFEQ